MQIDIRPRTVGENLGLVFQLIGKHFPVLLLIQGVLSVPGLALTLWSETPEIRADPAIEGLVALAGLTAAAILTPIATAASIAIVAGSFLGERTSFGQALAIGLRRLFPLLGYAIVVGLLTAIGFAACIVPGVIVMTIFFVGNCAIVLEERGVGRAMSRSSDLTRGRRWNVFVFVLLAICFQMLPGMITTVAMIASGAIDDPNAGIGYGVVIASWVVGLIVSLFWVVSPIVVYFSLRAEKDGFDVEQLANLVDEIGQRAGSSGRR